MQQATATASRITQTRGKSLANAPRPASLASLHRMSHCYISTGSRQFNRQPVRLEIAISPTKQTPAPQFNRRLFTSSQNRFSRSPNHDSIKQMSAVRLPTVSSQQRHLQNRAAHHRATNHQSLLTDHHSPLTAFPRITSHGLSRTSYGQCEKTTDSPLPLQFRRSLLLSDLRPIFDWQAACPHAYWRHCSSRNL